MIFNLRRLKNTLISKGWWALEPELDICVFSLTGLKASEISAKNRMFFEQKAEEDIQKLTDSFIKKIDEILEVKEAENMKV